MSKKVFIYSLQYDELYPDGSESMVVYPDVIYGESVEEAIQKFRSTHADSDDTKYRILSVEMICSDDTPEEKKKMALTECHAVDRAVKWL